MLCKSMKNKVLMLLEKDLLFPMKDRRVIKEAVSLIQNGYEVDIITWPLHLDSDQLPENYKYKNINIKRIFINFPPIKARIIHKLIPLIKLFFKTIQHGIKKKYDFVHCHDSLPLLAGYIIKLSHNAKFIYDSHELNPYRDEPKIIMKCFKFAELFLKNSWDAVISTNKPRTDFMQNYLGNQKYVVCHNYPLFENNKQFQIIENQTTTFVYQGGINNKRGIDNLLKALVDIDNVFLHLLGTGFPSDEYYHEMIDNLNLKSKVHFHGAIDMKDVFQIMKTCDIGIVSLRNTSLNNYYCAPNKIYDYMKAGIAILGPDFPHMKEIIKPNGIGYTCNFDEVESIINAISYFIENKNKLSDMKKKSFDLWKTKYNWKSEEAKLVTLYDSLKNE